MSMSDVAVALQMIIEKVEIQLSQQELLWGTQKELQME